MAITRFLICLVTITAAVALPNSRILEGQDAVSGAYPWVVSVRVDNAHACGGNIISARHILTAGHCVSSMGTVAHPVGSVTCRVGSINQFAGGKIVHAQSINIHPSYGNFLHDVAIITLSEPLTWNEKTRMIPIAAADEEIAEGTEVTITGWGLLSTGATPYKLQHTSMKSLTSEDCEYSAGYGYDSTLCLSHDEKKGISRGDAGAGAVNAQKLVGILSFAFGGGGTKYPDIAAKISYYREWIDSVIA